MSRGGQQIPALPGDEFTTAAGCGSIPRARRVLAPCGGDTGCRQVALWPSVNAAEPGGECWPSHFTARTARPHTALAPRRWAGAGSSGQRPWDTGLARNLLSIGSSGPRSGPGRAQRGPWEGAAVTSQQKESGSGQETVLGAKCRGRTLSRAPRTGRLRSPLPAVFRGMEAAAAPGASLGGKCQHKWGFPGAQPRPEPSSHRAPAAFHPGPDISVCRAFGKQHFNALAVKAVENVRGVVQEGSREPATPWACRALAEPCQGSWDGVGSCGAPRLSETHLQSQPSRLLNIIYAYSGYFCRVEAGAACPRWILQPLEARRRLSPHPPQALPPAITPSLPSCHTNSRLKGSLGIFSLLVLGGFFIIVLYKNGLKRLILFSPRILLIRNAKCGSVAPAADAKHLPKLGLPHTHHFLEVNNVPQVGSVPRIRSDPQVWIYSQVWGLLPGSGSATNMGRLLAQQLGSLGCSNHASPLLSTLAVS